MTVNIKSYKSFINLLVKTLMNRMYTDRYTRSVLALLF